MWAAWSLVAFDSEFPMNSYNLSMYSVIDAWPGTHQVSLLNSDKELFQIRKSSASTIQCPQRDGEAMKRETL